MATSPVVEKMEDSTVRVILLDMFSFHVLLWYFRPCHYNICFGEQDLLLNMIQLDPDKRLSAEEYLQWQRGNVFPECFYGSIYEYMQSLTQPQWGPADTKIDKYDNSF